MLKKNLSIEQIAEYLSLSLKDVEEVVESLKNENH